MIPNDIHITADARYIQRTVPPQLSLPRLSAFLGRPSITASRDTKQ